MSVVLWVLAALAAGAITEEFLSWITPVCRFVLRKGAQQLPEDWQSRYAEEWQAELLALPAGAFTRIVWTARTLIAVRSLRATLGEVAADKQIGRDVTESELPLTVARRTSYRQPTVVRITLGAELRRLRIASGIGRDDAGWAIRSSSAKVNRLESGHIGIKERDVVDLLSLYGVTDLSTIDTFMRLVRQADDSGWWHQHTDALPGGHPVFELERSASLIRAYGSQKIPDLLQTPDYARASLHFTYWRSETDTNAVLHRLRSRQDVLDSPSAPRLWTVIDEGALRRPRGGVAVMRAQIEHLIEVSQEPHITLQVLPLAAGPSGVHEDFTIFRFRYAELPDVVHIEQMTSSLYLEGPDDVEDYTAPMESISIWAQSPDSSRAILNDILADYGR